MVYSLIISTTSMNSNKSVTHMLNTGQLIPLQEEIVHGPLPQAMWNEKLGIKYLQEKFWEA